VNLSDQHTALTVCLEIVASRQHDYAKDGIPLLETLKSAVKSGVTIEQSLYQLFHKQLSAYERYVATGQLDSEPIESRLKDAANYLGLFNFYLTQKKELHAAWSSHFAGLPCIYQSNPDLSTSITHRAVCQRCSILTWLAHH